MKLEEFNVEITDLVTRAMKEGVAKKKFTVPELVECLGGHAAYLDEVWKKGVEAARAKKIASSIVTPDGKPAPAA